MKEFVIPFLGLKTGKHTYDFEIDQSFFEAFESDLLENPSIQVRLELDKMSNMLVLDLSAKGVSHTICDRCGGDLDMDIETHERIIVKFGEEPYGDTDEIIMLDSGAYEIDVSLSIYEMLILNLPARHIHPHTNLCDREALKRLSEFEHDETEQTGDPRWEALKKLRN